MKYWLTQFLSYSVIFGQNAETGHAASNSYLVESVYRRTDDI